MGLPGTKGVIDINISQACKLEAEILPYRSLAFLSLKPPRIRQVYPAYLPRPEFPDREVDRGIDPRDAFFRFNRERRDMDLRVQLLLKILDDRLYRFVIPADYVPVFLSFGLPTCVIMIGLPPRSTI